MQYCGTLLAVKDMERAKRFYCGVLGMKVEADLGANVSLSGGLSLQTLDTWTEFIERPASDVVLRSNVGELYYEEEDIEAFLKRLNAVEGVAFVHPMKEQSWGQRTVRFYDPDGHIVEVGEAMPVVVKRFLDSGMTVAETAARMDVPVAYIESLKG